MSRLTGVPRCRADGSVMTQDWRAGDACQRRVRADLFLAAAFALAQREEVGDFRQAAAHPHPVERLDLGDAVLVAHHAGDHPRPHKHGRVCWPG